MTPLRSTPYNLHSRTRTSDEGDFPPRSILEIAAFPTPTALPASDWLKPRFSRAFFSFDPSTPMCVKSVIPESIHPFACLVNPWETVLYPTGKLSWHILTGNLSHSPRSTVIPDAKALGQWIRKRRLELDGMNQQQLADRVENPETGKSITRSYVHKLENATPHDKSGNPPAPSLDLLYNLSRALQTSLATPLAELGYLKKAEADKMESPTTHPIRLLNLVQRTGQRRSDHTGTNGEDPVGAPSRAPPSRGKSVRAKTQVSQVQNRLI